MSPVDMTRAMASLLRMHQSELEMQVGLAHAVCAHLAVRGFRPHREKGLIRVPTLIFCVVNDRDPCPRVGTQIRHCVFGC